MKKLLSLFFLGILSLSCSNDDNSSTTPSEFTNIPDANAAYDSNNYGIYKGVFAGSSGTAYINIQNDGNLFAILTIDGVESKYTTSETVSLNNDISGLTFTNGSYYFDFNVGAKGNEPTISNIHIEDHPLATISIVKERSNSLVRCYLGTAHKLDPDYIATFNLIVFNNQVLGLLADESDGVKKLGGLITNNTINGQLDDDTRVFSGAIDVKNESIISGVWNNTDTSEQGSWQGVRKL